MAGGLSPPGGPFSLIAVSVPGSALSAAGDPETAIKGRAPVPDTQQRPARTDTERPKNIAQWPSVADRDEQWPRTRYAFPPEHHGKRAGLRPLPDVTTLKHSAILTRPRMKRGRHAAHNKSTAPPTLHWNQQDKWAARPGSRPSGTPLLISNT